MTLKRKPERTGFKRKQKVREDYNRKGEFEMKIDVSTIKGFEEMTAEQKVEALLGLDIPDKVDMSLFVSKDVADKYASEAATLRKQLRERMTDEEAAKAKEAADRQELQEKYDALVRESTISTYTAKFLALGYDEALAKNTAEALASGNTDKVFENQSVFNANREAAIKAEQVKNMPETKHLEPPEAKEPYVPPIII